MAKAIEKGLPHKKAENMFKISRSVSERHYKKKISSDKEGSLSWESNLKNALLGVLCFVHYGTILWTNLICAGSLKLT